MEQAGNAPKTLYTRLKTFTHLEAGNNEQAPSQALCDKIAMHFTKKIDLIYDNITRDGRSQLDLSADLLTTRANGQKLEYFPLIMPNASRVLTHYC